MVDWWQALPYLLAGGLITVAASYLTHRWSTSANRQAEERQAKRRVEEDQRQAIRQLRRERIQPVLDFLESAKLCAAEQPVKKAVDGAVERAQERRRPEDGPPAEEWQEVARELLGPEPDPLELMRGCARALVASASVPGLQQAVVKLYEALPTSNSRKVRPEFYRAVQSVEQLVDQYLAGAATRAA